MSPAPSSARPSPVLAQPTAGGAASRYEMRGELARGGMARVYRVFDRLTGELRAMKRVSWDGSGSRFEVDALEREYAVLASLTHPRIIRVYDYGIDASDRYYTMDLLDGRDMRELAPLAVKDACRHLRDVATSLALIHARRLIHRDLSPSNVRLGADGHCKLIDFGALTAFGPSRVVIGTPPTIAPEALNRESLDQRTDLYSLGTLAYWMLTRRHAYPAHEIADLPAQWEHAPLPPSHHNADVPAELDALVLALLRHDRLARPATAAEVIARLEVIGGLPAEDSIETERLAQSYLLNPHFTGRAFQLRQIEAQVATCRQGRGSSLLVQAAPGLGRTRLLEEAALRAQLAGAVVLRADGSAHRSTYGTARALILDLIDSVPELVREHGGSVAPLASLGLAVMQRLAAHQQSPSSPPPPASSAARLGVQTVPASDGGVSKRAAVSSRAAASSGSGPSSRVPPSAAPLSTRSRAGSPEAWLCALSRVRPLVVIVDNVDDADDASLGFLLSLAQLAPGYALLVMLSEGRESPPRQALGLAGLRERSTRVELAALGDRETLELVLSLFGEAPNAERFAEWLFSVSGGNPLHAIEICRQLATRRLIRYSAGLWSLPTERPEVELPAALGEALLDRLRALGPLARELVEALSLQREQPTLELCQRLLPNVSEIAVRQRLDELALHGVLYSDGNGYRFSSSALRDALLAQMDPPRLARTHRGLGEALAASARGSPALLVQAGWHLLQGGDEERGAHLIASVTHDYFTARTLAANLHRIGKPLEAALLAYNRHRRSLYERLPLLCALAQVGWYEDHVWAERYGDQALDALDDLAGFNTARRARRFLGGWLALQLGLGLALLRFWLTPRSERPYTFSTLLTQLLGTFTALCGTAALTLDGVRAKRVASGLAPFSILPERLTPKGFYRYCDLLQSMSDERPARAYAEVSVLRAQFEDRSYYPSLPDEGRRLLVAAATYGRALLGVMRAHTDSVLEDADALENMGLELYALIGSHHRYLYHFFRGEFEQASAARVEVDMHAARMGSLWQVELCETAALIAMYVNMLQDIVGATRLVHRLEQAMRRAPGLGIYWRIARAGATLLRGEIDQREAFAEEFAREPEKSFIGWTSALGALARAFNAAGEHRRAIEICERADALMHDDDREFVVLFSVIDIELAHARAGLGEHGAALAVLDANLARFGDTDHPLLLGLLHEARARVCFQAGNRAEYSKSLDAVARWFRRTGAPVLIARYDRLVELGSATGARPLAGLAAQHEAASLPTEDPFGAAATAVLGVPATAVEDALATRRALKKSAG